MGRGSITHWTGLNTSNERVCLSLNDVVTIVEDQHPPPGMIACYVHVAGLQVAFRVQVNYDTMFKMWVHAQEG